MCRCLKAEGGESQVFNFFSVYQIHNSAAVNAVASQTVGMPRENALGFAFFNLTQHKIELRSAGCFRRAAFFKGADYV